MPGAGDRNRKITIQRASTVRNSLNEKVVTWSDFQSVMAERKDISDGEKAAAGQVGSFLNARFVVLSSTTMRTVTPVDRLSHEGKIWSIHGVKERDEGRFHFIEITAVKDAD